MSENASSGERSNIGFTNLDKDVFSFGKITLRNCRSIALMRAMLKGFASSSVSKYHLETKSTF
jgi:putative heme iron utilization protein